MIKEKLEFREHSGFCKIFDRRLKIILSLMVHDSVKATGVKREK